MGLASALAGRERLSVRRIDKKEIKSADASACGKPRQKYARRWLQPASGKEVGPMEAAHLHSNRFRERRESGTDLGRAYHLPGVVVTRRSIVLIAINSAHDPSKGVLPPRNVAFTPFSHGHP